MEETSESRTPDTSQGALTDRDAALTQAAEEIRSAYLGFVERVGPSLNLYTALGKRAEEIRKENEKLPL
jgi:hypothetical protein